MPFGIDDAAIRNAVEGYRSEGEIIAEAEKAFETWWNSIALARRHEFDGFALWQSYRDGRLEMARETGYLPEGPEDGGVA